jgi:hypothetical protein
MKLLIYVKILPAIIFLRYSHGYFPTHSRWVPHRNHCVPPPAPLPQPRQGPVGHVYEVWQPLLCQSLERSFNKNFHNPLSLWVVRLTLVDGSCGEPQMQVCVDLTETFPILVDSRETPTALQFPAHNYVTQNLIYPDVASKVQFRSLRWTKCVDCHHRCCLRKMVGSFNGTALGHCRIWPPAADNTQWAQVKGIC